MSITVPLEGFGGGAALNFDVKAYATEELLLAATPKENTIGVITTTAINGWVFSATEPTEPAQGMVWITVGTSSTVEFNALKKNAIQVYPLSAKQYVDGAWVDVTAMSYQGGEWVEWVTYLYNEGDECEDITGGWGAYALKYSSAVSHTATAPTVTKLEDGSMKITYGYAGSATSTSAYGGGVVRTKNKIDLSEYTALEFTGYMYNPSYNYVCLNIWSDMGSYVTSNVVAKIGANDEKTIITFTDLDISGLSGEYYIGFSMYANAAGAEVVIKTLGLKR